MQEIDINEYVKTPRFKPIDENIVFLRKQKQKVLNAKKEEINLNVGGEYELCALMSERTPRGKKNQRLREIIRKIKKLQQEKNICEFNRNFLNTLLKTYTQIHERKKEITISELLNKAKCRELIITKTYLVNKKSKFGVEERIREQRAEIKKFYTFL